MKKIYCILYCFLFFAYANAQDVLLPEKPAGMRANEKIYVVAAVAGTILLGLLLYVIRLDTKISKLEKSNQVVGKNI